MRIGIVANDTRGGVEPYAALARSLKNRGHDPRLIAPSDFAPLVEGSGIAFAGLTGNSQEDMRGASEATRRGPIASMRIVAAELGTRIRTWTQEALDAADGVELLTGGVGGMVVALGVADKLGVPFVPAHLQPIDAPTSEYPGVLLPWVRPNLLGHRLTSLAVWAPFAKAMGDARREVLGLSGRSTATRGQPALYAISPSVLRVPGADHHTTGYWFGASDPTWQPSPELLEFLERGPAVSIGFGSMASKDPEAVTATVLDATRTAGVRVVLLSGWGGVSAAAQGDDVLVQTSVPHEWLFPRMSAVVHHGGAGTTAAGLRAGVPNIVVPFTVDQPFWGDRVAALGVGPKPIPRRKLTSARLAAALGEALESSQLQGRARDLGARVSAEDGLGEAALVYEKLR
jgi:UDP:flavonoid glycosyltransferase YjiC (YdhE family)